MSLPASAALLAALVLAVPATARSQASSDEDLIRGVRAASNEAIARHDVPSILATLEPEYQAAVSSGDFIEGREAMGEAFLARFRESPDASYVRTPETVELSGTGPLAAESGTWIGTWTTPAGPYRVGGRYMAYWRKVGGAWRIHAEVFVPLSCQGSGCP